MRLKTGDWLYQSETFVDRYGKRWQRVVRRRVVAVEDDAIALTGAEELQVPADEPPAGYEWHRMQGLLGMGGTLTMEQLGDRGFSTSFRLGRGGGVKSPVQEMAEELADGIRSAYVIVEVIEDSPPAQLVLLLSILRSALRQLNERAERLAATRPENRPEGHNTESRL